jgi:glycosyltransferase involved in cell wall biosynthesis
VLLGQRVAVVIPAFNTGARVRRVLDTLPPFVDLAVVVDDASTDDTAQALTSIGNPAVAVAVLRHAENRGVGGALASGYREALARGADLVAVMAGDGQMHPADLAALAAPVAAGAADYAKGNRLRHPDCVRAMPAVRYAGNLALSWLTRRATGLRGVGDSQCGYTVISARALRSLDLDGLWRRYGYPNHLLGALALQRRRVVDVVVRPVYADEVSGVRWRDALVVIPRILLAVALARYAGRARVSWLGLPGTAALERGAE